MASPDSPGIEIPDKVFFRIGEVSDLTGVKAYVLRFWEKEFPTLRPKKSRSGQRRYKRGDIEQIVRIKTLLWDRKFTIQGARDELKRSRSAKAGAAPLPAAAARNPDTSPSMPSLRVQAQLEGAKTELDEARERLASARARVADLEQALDQAHARRAKAEGEAARLASKLEESEADLSALRAAHTSLEERHAALTAAQEELHAELDQVRQEGTSTQRSESDPFLRDELLAVREELIRFKARLGTRLPTLS